MELSGYAVSPPGLVAAGSCVQPGRSGGPPWSGHHARGGGACEAPLPPAGAVLAGRYRLADRIGGPEWSPLWKGTDELLSRPVTVRVFRPGPVPAAVTAALRGTGRLADPRLARIYDADEHAEHPYIVSEWAPGERLDDLLGSGLPRPRLAAAITTEVAAALAVAHAADQAHLCLTPQHVRCHGNGVKITGLGIEAALCGLPPGAHPAAVIADTQALGRLLYALLTGYWPGSEATTLPAAPRHRGRPYTPAQLRPWVPAELSAIASSAMQPGSVAAPPVRTPAELAAALRAARRPAAGPAEPLRPARRRAVQPRPIRVAA